MVWSDWLDRHLGAVTFSLALLMAICWVRLGWELRGRGFTCPAGQSPEMVWSEQGVTVTGKCEPDPIRYIPRGE
jgi:hypothetical protein